MNISVVIPFYHAEEYFEEAYSSIKAQAVDIREVIVVVDGCGEQALPFLTSYPDVKVVNLEINSGPGVARNEGVKATAPSCEWIAFLDADDKWAPVKLRTQIEFLKANKQFSACHTGIIEYKNGEEISQRTVKPYDLSLKEALEGCHMLPSSLMIKKDVFMNLDGFDRLIRCGEDQEFSIRLVKDGYKLGFVAEPLVYLRREDHGNVSSNGILLFRSNLKILRKHLEIYKKYDGLTSKFIYETFMDTGARSRGISRKVFYLVGRAIRLFYPKVNEG